MMSYHTIQQKIDEIIAGGLDSRADDHDRLIADTAALASEMDSDEAVRQALHTILHDIYQLHVTIPRAAANTAEGSPTLHAVRGIIEDAFLRSEDAQLPVGILTEVPCESDAYRSWFFDLIHRHPAATHPLYTEYLGDRGTLDDLRYLLVQESTIDAATDDFIALMQVGMRGQAKMEMATNFWDEMGNGDPTKVHSLLFDQALRRFGISLDEPEMPLETEALICGNLQLMLGLRRKYVYMGIGYFAVVEYMAPDRFRELMKAWTRLKIGPEGSDYHVVHIDVDEHHAAGWFGNVVSPVIANDPLAAEEVTRGALYRLNTSARYLDRIYPNLPSRANLMASI